jgi:hypothetical protein
MNVLTSLLFIPFVSAHFMSVPLKQTSTNKPAQPIEAATKPTRCKYLITVTDDMVVDVYHNGRPVPDSKRTLLREIYGATVERMDVEVKKGDWLVFNVANNRLRWGGAYYFAVAGCFGTNEYGFVSSLDTGQWSACDTPRDADRFIAQKTYLRHQAAKPITQMWAEGTNFMKEYAGDNWSGTPLWGSSRCTWIKVIVE